MKQKLLFLLTALCFGFVSGVKADVMPTPVYSLDFEGAESVTDFGGVQHGDGSLLTSGDARFGKYYQNMPNATAATNWTNFLEVVPTTNPWAAIRDANSNAFTISFWCNAKVANEKSIGNYWGSLFTGYTESGLTAHQWPVGPDVRYLGQFHFNNNGAYADENGTGEEMAAIGAWDDDNNWHHFAWVFSNLGSATFNLKLIIDGTQKYSRDLTVTGTNKTGINMLDDLDRFTIGGNTPIWENPDNAFAYDDIAIYDEALTADQILQIMSNKLQAEIVGALDYSTPYWRVWNKTPIWINVGETGYYKFVNHNKGGNPYENWYLYAANESSENLTVLRADNHVNIGGGTINSFPETSDITADLADATVELYVSLADAGDGTNTLTSTAIITKADHSVMSPNYVYTQTGINVSKLKLYVSVEKCWLELFEQQGYPTTVSKTITSAKWATYCSPYALDFTSDIDNLADVYIVTGGNAGVLAMTSVKGGTVPANTGLLLKGEGNCVIPVAASSSTNVDDNKLVGVTSNTQLPAEEGYVLMASPKLGFYKNANAFTVGAYTAYLPIDFDDNDDNNTSARSAFFGFEEDPTAINAIEATETEAGALKDGKYLIGNKIVLVKNGMKYDANGKKLN